MPVVLSFDDPALSATLASQAGSYARTRDQRILANQESNQAYEQANYALNQRQRNMNDANALEFQEQQQGGNQGPPPGPWQESTRSGATIYHGGGFNDAPPGYAGGGGSGSGGSYSGGAGSAYLHPQQQSLMHYVDQLEQGGHLDPAEAIRYRALITSGQNPFEKPTMNEEIRRGTQLKGQLTPYQEAELGLGADRVENDRAKQQYTQKRTGLTESIRAKVAALKASAYMLTPEEKEKAQGEINDLTQQLIDLGDAPDAGSGGAGGSGLIDYLNKLINKPGAPGGAGSTAVQQRPTAGAAPIAGTAGSVAAAAAPAPAPTGKATVSGGRQFALRAADDGGVVFKDEAGKARHLTPEQVMQLVAKYGSADAAKAALASGQVKFSDVQ